MSLFGKVWDAAKAAIPPLGGARIAILAALALGALALAAFSGWWIFVRPRQAQVAAATERVTAATATGTAGAAESTLHIVTDNARTIAAIDALTRENDRAIQSSKGAAQSVDPALDAAGRHALCLRSAYRADPGCAAVRGDGGGIGAAPANAGSGASGK